MRQLLLLRHAKSAWDDLDLDDFDRGLAPRGLKAAPAMGKAIKELGLIPDLVLCSTAVRTRATLTLLLRQLPQPLPDIRFEDRLYLAPPMTMLDVLATAGGNHDCVMMIGHNPGIHALALELTGSGSNKHIGELASKFPTCALAVLEVSPLRWRDLTPGCGRLVTFLTPRSVP